MEICAHSSWWQKNSGGDRRRRQTNTGATVDGRNPAITSWYGKKIPLYIYRGFIHSRSLFGSTSIKRYVGETTKKTPLLKFIVKVKGWPSFYKKIWKEARTHQEARNFGRYKVQRVLHMCLRDNKHEDTFLWEIARVIWSMFQMRWHRLDKFNSQDPLSTKLCAISPKY